MFSGHIFFLSLVCMFLFSLLKWCFICCFLFDVGNSLWKGWVGVGTGFWVMAGRSSSPAIAKRCCGDSHAVDTHVGMHPAPVWQDRVLVPLVPQPPPCHCGDRQVQGDKYRGLQHPHFVLTRALGPQGCHPLWIRDTGSCWPGASSIAWASPSPWSLGLDCPSAVCVGGWC